MPLNDFYNKIVALQEFDLEKEISEIIIQNSFYISGLLRTQLQEGRDGKGKLVTIFGKPYYSDLTIQDKYYHGVGLGKQTEFITNFMSGVFYASLKVRVSGNTFESYSEVDYFGEIIRRSGGVIMELDEIRLRELSEEIIIPELTKRFNKAIHGT